MSTVKAILKAAAGHEEETKAVATHMKGIFAKFEMAQDRITELEEANKKLEGEKDVLKDRLRQRLPFDQEAVGALAEWALGIFEIMAGGLDIDDRIAKQAAEGILQTL